MKNCRFPATLLGAVFTFIVSIAHAETPKVVTSIKPLHSLVSGVMEGVLEPFLLVRGNASPHTYSMRPSDAEALRNADLVFWMGPSLETFMQRPLQALTQNKHVVTLLEDAGLMLLPAREGGVWEAHMHDEHDHDHGHDEHDDHDHTDHHEAEEHHEEPMDAHAWLDVNNARKIVAIVAEKLTKTDPDHAETYRQNAARMTQRLDTLDSEMQTMLEPVKNRPFVVFHDAYRYLENAYGLNAVGSITISPEQRPSARRVSELRAKLNEVGAACVFAEPQFEPTLVNTIIEGTKAGKGTLDPEGANIPDGPDLYFTLMRSNAQALAGCLGKN